MIVSPVIHISSRPVGGGHPCFVIAEIGQNHQGSTDIAKRLIDAAKESGADCVKFQKSCATEKFTKNVLESPYTGVNSWGATYGEHKAFLEFSECQFRELLDYAKHKDILFSSSAMDPASLTFLTTLGLPFIKIGSGDSNNLPFIGQAAQNGTPLIISTGMTDMDGVRGIYEEVKSSACQFALLHCVSSYPTPLVDANLKVIETFQREFPEAVIGYSGHEIGYNLTLAAVTLGAKIVERHITLDKTLKGTDHTCSLEPDEFKNMTRGIREIETGLGAGIKRLVTSEIPCFEKLSKVVVAARDLSAGMILGVQDMKFKVAQQRGIPPNKSHSLVGRILKGSVDRDCVLQESILATIDDDIS